MKNIFCKNLKALYVSLNAFQEIIFRVYIQGVLSVLHYRSKAIKIKVECWWFYPTPKTGKMSFCSYLRALYCSELKIKNIERLKERINIAG